MAKREASKGLKSKRQIEHAALLEAALARPGVRKVMEVYQDWQSKEQIFMPYQLAAKGATMTTTTSSANIH